MANNFYIYLDREGKMPQLRYHKRKCDSHPFYIRYVGDKPVSYHGPLEILAMGGPKGKIWDYSINEYVSMEGLRNE